MKTPAADFIGAYADSGVIRAHMPGHKGRGEDVNALDITEIKGADNLYEARGIIGESEKNAADIFGSFKTVYSAGGSTLCIQAMIAMCMNVTGRKKIIAARNCHKAFISACALLDAEVEWIYPEYETSIVSGYIPPQEVDRALRSEDKPACVYITTPDYLGRMTDIGVIAHLCHINGTFLAVDNAHGAYLRFILDGKGTPLHPIFHGADICCDSAHKTLPVLTGGAYLHICSSELESYEGFAKDMMSLFGSSSPSYLILRSLDLCNRYMKEHALEDFAKMERAQEEIKAELSSAWHIEVGECGKLTVFAPRSGLSGYELAERLRERQIECEYADSSHVVLMLTGLTESEIYRIGEAFKNIPMPRTAVAVPRFKGFVPPKRAMSIREAVFAPCESVPVEEAEGRICARTVSVCPPGVAVAVGGEIISSNQIGIMNSYGIGRVNVVLEAR